MAYVKLLFGSDGAQDLFQLKDKDVFIIGRSQDADIKVMDIKVSRNHCRIEARGDKFYVTDNKSRNGTFVNGEKIVSTELKDGDHIKIGFSVMEFHTAPEQEEAAAPEGMAASRPDPAPKAPEVDSKIKRCYMCGKVLDEMDIIGGTAKEIEDRLYCAGCVASVKDKGGLSAEAPARPEPKAEPAPEPEHAEEAPGETAPEPGAPPAEDGKKKRLVDLLGDDEEEDDILS